MFALLYETLDSEAKHNKILLQTNILYHKAIKFETRNKNNARTLCAAEE